MTELESRLAYYRQCVGKFVVTFDVKNVPIAFYCVAIIQGETFISLKRRDGVEFLVWKDGEKPVDIYFLQPVPEIAEASSLEGAAIEAANKKRLKELTPTNEEWHEIGKRKQPPEEWFVGDQECPFVQPVPEIADTSNYEAVAEAAAALPDLPGAADDQSKPRIVCLCGSTRFKQEFIEANFRETMAGKIVLSVGWFSHADDQQRIPSLNEKFALDELHKRKIDRADEVLILNVGGYIGESTCSELEYAQEKGKVIRFLEPVPDLPGEADDLDYRSVPPERVGTIEAKWKETAAAPLACHDCGLLYSDNGWCDTFVDNDVWKQITPGDHCESGLLCFNCIARRCVERGLRDVQIKITSGPFDVMLNDPDYRCVSKESGNAPLKPSQEDMAIDVQNFEIPTASMEEVESLCRRARYAEWDSADLKQRLKRAVMYERRLSTSRWELLTESLAKNAELKRRLAEAAKIIFVADGRAKGVKRIGDSTTYVHVEMTDAKWQKLYLAVVGEDE
jgi:hypothetical protein